MTLAAMSERVDQVVASVHHDARRRIGRERAWTEEQQLPHPKRPAPSEGELQVVRLTLAAARWKRAQIGPEVAHILVVDARERRIWKRREVMRAVGPAAFAQGAREVLLGPTPDSRLGVRRDVGAVEGAEGRLERSAPGIGLRVFARLGMAPDATRRLRKVLPPLGFASLRDDCRGPAKEQ